jgi:DNA-binding beta-propeller fold protein YncE
MFSARKRILVVALLVFAAVGTNAFLAQEATRPGYPKVSLATWYKVDPSWPQKTAAASWGEMPGVAVDGKDQVWIYTRAKPPVQVYDAGGKFLRGWGDELVGKAHHIKFDPEGNVWLADVGFHVVMQLTPEGKLLKTLGTKGTAGEDETHFNQPTDMAVTSAGEVFVSDGYGNSRIVHFDKTGKFVKAWGKLGTRPGEFSIPHAIALDSKNRVYVADRNNVRVQVFEPSGKLLSEWRDVVVPWGFCATRSPGGADEIWVCGSSPMPWREGDGALGCPPKDQVFMKFNTDGKLLQLWTVPKGPDGHEEPGDCNWVHSIAVDSKGNLYAGDIKGHRAQKFVKQPGAGAVP